MQPTLPKTTPSIGAKLETYYRLLYQRFGAQHWWPARSRLEVVVGAVLTQNTSWHNVEKAIARLRKEGLLQHKNLLNVGFPALESCIRSAGYYRQKARAIKEFATFLERQFGGSLDRLFRLPLTECRDQLLSLKGFGPETVDSIMLYAGGHPLFVSDAYTRRILARHGLLAPGADYAQTQALIHRSLKPDVAFYNEFHALFVMTGKTYCYSKNPNCAECPLESDLPRLSGRHSRPGADESRHELDQEAAE